MVVVTGEPGIGKSRLVAELPSLVGDATVRVGRVSAGRGDTFAAVAEIIVAELAGRSPREALAAVGIGGADAAVIVPQLAAVTSGGAVAETSAAARDTAWAAFLAAAAGVRPRVVVFEDLHWAEPALLTTIGTIAAVSAPILIVATARPDLDVEQLQWPVERVVRLDLAPLAENQIAMIMRRARDDQPSDELVRRAGGNPLHATHLAAIDGDDADLHAASLQAVIGARIDAASATAKSVLQQLAVYGEPVPEVALRDLHPDAVAELGWRRLVARDAAGALAVQHDVIREVAYGQLARRPRAGIHEQAAAYHAARSARGAPFAVARHLKAALQLRERDGEATSTLRSATTTALLAAAEAAYALADHTAAISYAENAVQIGVDDATRARCLYRIAIAGVRLGQPNPTILHDAEAASLAQGNLLHATELAYETATAAEYVFADRVMSEAADARAAGLADQLSPGRIRSLAVARVAIRLIHRRQEHDAVTLVESELASARRVNARDAFAALLTVRGWARCRLGELRGVGDFESAATLAEDDASPEAPIFLGNVAFEHLVLGHHELAAGYTARMAVWARRFGNQWMEELAVIRHLALAGEGGDLDAPEQLAARTKHGAANAAEATEFLSHLVRATEPQRARKLALEAVAHADTLDPLAVVYALAACALAELACCDRAAASATCDRLLAAVGGREASTQLAAAMLDGVVALTALGRRAEAATIAVRMVAASPYGVAARQIADGAYRDAEATLTAIPSIPRARAVRSLLVDSATRP